MSATQRSYRGNFAVRMVVAAVGLFVAVVVFCESVQAEDQILGQSRIVVQDAGVAGKNVRMRGRGAIVPPTPGSSGDPSQNAGTLELITRRGSVTVALAASADWKVAANGRWSRRGRRGDPLRRIVINQRGVVAILEEGATVATGQAGFVAARLTFGDWRACARFDEQDVRRDAPGLLVARHRRSVALDDCSDASLYGACEALETDLDECFGHCGNGGSCQPDAEDFQGCRCVSDDMACGDTAPLCGGTCPSGLECKSSPGYPIAGCRCEPPGAACGDSAFPSCGGVCNEGEACSPVADPLNGTYCRCRSENAPCGTAGPCAPGTYCAHGGSNFFLCVPLDL